MPIVIKSDYGNGVVCYTVNDSYLGIDAAADAYHEIAHEISRLRSNIRELVLDVHIMEKADPLALSLLPAVKDLCKQKKLEFYVSGLSETMKEKMILHSSFKGMFHSEHSHHHSVSEHIEHLGDISLDVGESAVSFIGFTGEFFSAVIDAVKNPRRIRWRETFYYMDMCGADALPIVVVICFLMGLILGFQGAIQLHKLGTDVYLADAVGLIITKELGPLMVAMIATGRAGSAFAAEIGTMKVGEEVDAMTTMGFVPSRFLFIPKLLAMLTVMPLLTVFGDFIGVLGGMAVGYFKLDLPIDSYVNRTLTVLGPIHLAESIVKSLVFAFIITVIGCIRGFEADNDAQGVGRSATSSVVTSIFLIVLADTLLTVLFSMVQ